MGMESEALPMQRLRSCPRTAGKHPERAAPAELHHLPGAEEDHGLRREPRHRDGDRHGQDLLLHQDDHRAEQAVRLEQVHRRRAEHRDPRGREEVVRDHGRALPENYGKKPRYFIYNSKQLHELESFSSDAGINVMIINIQAFNAPGKDTRRIYDELDDFQSRQPIDVISRTGRS